MFESKDTSEDPSPEASESGCPSNGKLPANHLTSTRISGQEQS